MHKSLNISKGEKTNMEEKMELDIDKILAGLNKFKEKEPFSDIPIYIQKIVQAIKENQGIIVFTILEEPNEIAIIYYLAKLGYNVDADKRYSYGDLIRLYEIKYQTLRIWLLVIGQKGIVVETDAEMKWIVGDAFSNLIDNIRYKYSQEWGSTYMMSDGKEGLSFFFEKPDSILKTLAETIQEATKNPWSKENVDVDKYSVEIWEKQTESAVWVFLSSEAFADYIIAVMKDKLTV